MTELQIVGVIILVVIVLLIIISLVNRIVQDREVDTAIQDNMDMHFTNDPLFDEVTQIAQNVIADYQEYLRETKQHIERAEETSAEILEKRLRLQRIEIQLDLLEEITFDNVMKYYGSDKLDWYTVGMVIHYVRRTIDRRLT